MERIIRVCPGIGDNIWLIQKLINTGERFHFELAGGEPRRGKQLFDLLPQVTITASYLNYLSYGGIQRYNIHRGYPKWEHIRIRRVQEMYLSMNEWLEHGKRIERFFPDLKTSYTIDYQTTIEEKDNARAIVPKTNYVGIYASAYSTQRAWGFWDEHGWFELISNIYKARQCTFVIIGAAWDIDLGDKLIALLKAKKIPYVDTIGQTLGTVVEIMKRLDYFIGFPSGLSILNETLGKNGLMFYPPHLKLMINAWADPDRIESEDYKGMLFCTPSEAFNWLILSRKIHG